VVPFFAEIARYLENIEMKTYTYASTSFTGTSEIACLQILIYAEWRTAYQQKLSIKSIVAE